MAAGDRRAVAAADEWMNDTWCVCVCGDSIHSARRSDRNPTECVL